MNASMTSAECKNRAAALLEKDYGVWQESRVPYIADAERHVASDAASEVFQGTYAAEFAAACQCFYIFRRLHDMVLDDPSGATLLGDYYFSRFSHYLIPLDSVPLIDAFSDYLKKDIKSRGDITDFLGFIRTLPAVLI